MKGLNLKVAKNVMMGFYLGLEIDYSDLFISLIVNFLL